MAAYPAKVKYKIYVIDNARSGVFRADQLQAYSLHDTGNSFDNENEAENWIFDNGERYYEYVVLKTFKMP